MTIEEAKREIRDTFTEVWADGIIEALEQEPCEDWHDIPSEEMTLEQARQAVKDLRKKLAEHLEQKPVLDKIRAEIEQIEINGYIRDVECFNAGLNMAVKIIDKY